MRHRIKNFFAILLSITLLSTQALPAKAATPQVSATDKIASTAREAASRAKEAAGKTADDFSAKAKKIAGETSDRVKMFVSKINTQDFQKGWDTAAKYVSSTYAAQKGKTYVESVQHEITDLQNALKSGSERGVEQEKGFTAEKWAAGTFNIDAAVKNTGERASRPDSNKLASTDISTSWGDDYSLKYYKSGGKSAKAQAQNFMENYTEYFQKAKEKGESPLSPDEYLDSYSANHNVQSLYDSIYKNQKRLIPADQMDETATYLKRRVAKEGIAEGDRRNLSSAAQETLDNLADRIESPKGAQSKPLTKEEAVVVTDLAKNGKFKPSDFGLSTSQLITPRFVLKQSVGAGVSAASLRMALTVAPDLFDILFKAVKEQKIDDEQLKKVGLDTVLNGSEGFVEGAVSNAVLTACHAGKMGVKMKNVSPEMVGMLVVILIDAARYGYQMSNGEISGAEYGDAMTKEIIVGIASQASGVVVKSIFPMIPFAYTTGSMAGGMLAAQGYEKGKTIVMNIQNAGGFEVVLPQKISEGVDVGKKTVAKLNLQKKMSDFKGAVVSTTKSGAIRIRQLSRN